MAKLSSNIVSCQQEENKVELNFSSGSDGEEYLIKEEEKARNTVQY